MSEHLRFFAKMLKQHAECGFPGLAQIVNNEMTGLSSSVALRRMRKSLRDAASKSQGPGPSGPRNAGWYGLSQGSSRGNGDRRSFQRPQSAGGSRAGSGSRPARYDPATSKCYNCFQIGHKSRDCSLPSVKPST
jgi:hypothetical protein